jgi:GDP-L-fucose synthase
MNSTLLITGSGGFLGTHVKQAFNNADDHRILTPRSSELNLLDYYNTSNYLRTYRPNKILHLSALCGGILKNKNSPADFLRDNAQMALNIYEAARQNNITCIYSLGSVCMYPKYTTIPFKEQDIWASFPEETNAPYGISKRVLLMLSQTYRQQYGFTGAFFVPVNMYGTHDNFDLTNSHVIPALIRKFITAIDNGETEVKCWGSGEVSREFLAAQDTSQALLKAVSMDFDYPEPINLGTGKEVKIIDLAELIAKLTGFDGKIVFTGDVSDGQPRRCLDTTKASQLLNWQATTSLEDGLKQTIAWYQENKQSILAKG